MRYASAAEAISPSQKQPLALPASTTRVTRECSFHNIPVPTNEPPWLRGRFWARATGDAGEKKVVALLEEGAGESASLEVGTKVTSATENPLSPSSSGWFWAKRETPKETPADREDRNVRQAWTIAEAITVRGGLCKSAGDVNIQDEANGHFPHATDYALDGTLKASHASNPRAKSAQEDTSASKSPDETANEAQDDTPGHVDKGFGQEAESKTSKSRQQEASEKPAMILDRAQMVFPRFH